MLPGHGCGFDFEQQVGAADVANDRYPGPVEIAFYGIEYLLDFGCFAVGNDLNQVFFAGLHFGKDGPDIFYRGVYLAFGIADIRGGSIGID